MWPFLTKIGEVSSAFLFVSKITWLLLNKCHTLLMSQEIITGQINLKSSHPGKIAYSEVKIFIMCTRVDLPHSSIHQLKFYLHATFNL